MRVVSGERRGTKLFSLEGMNTRPTSDKVKEAIFSMIQFDLQDAVCLDAFAGSGGLGIEALSRGASKCVFVENNRAALQIVKKNLEKTKLEDYSDVVFGDVISKIKHLEEKNYKFDLVFLDPPYNKGFVQKIMDSLLKSTILNDEVIVVVEHSFEDKLLDLYGDLALYKHKDYALTNVSIYKRSE